MMSLQQSQSKDSAHCISPSACVAPGCPCKPVPPSAAELPSFACRTRSSSRTASCAPNHLTHVHHACCDGDGDHCRAGVQAQESPCGICCSVQKGGKWSPTKTLHLEARRPHPVLLRRPGGPLKREAHAVIGAQRRRRVLEGRVSVNEAPAALALHQLAPCAALHLLSMRSMALPWTS